MLSLIRDPVLLGLLALSTAGSILQAAFWVACIRRPYCEHSWAYDPGPPEVVRCEACGAVEAW